MKITYNENPLNTVIELNESERQILWHNIKIEQMEYRMFSAHFNLDESRLDLKQAREEVDPSYYLDEDVNGNTLLDARVDELFEYYIESVLDNITKRFEQIGIKVSDGMEYLAELRAEKGVLTKRAPSEEEQKDIEFGYEKAKKIAEFDIGQTVTVHNKTIVSVEA